MHSLSIGTTYRYSRPYPTQDATEVPEIIDGLPNYFFYTRFQGAALPILDKGISSIESVKTKTGLRRPAILISTSPHKHGSESTPWQDEVDSDNGFVKYFGDNKSKQSPEKSPGNAVLLELFSQHNSGHKETRLKASPLLIFQRIPVEGRLKGNVTFHGLALITSAKLVTQFQPQIGYFTNYVFEFSIQNLQTENDYLDFNWINERRNGDLSDEICNRLAPKSWNDFIVNGTINIDKNRRRVAKLKNVKKSEQLPVINSRESKCLTEIYNFFTTTKKHHFELLASKVTSQVVSESGTRYVEGWITRGSGDRGVDFVGRIDIGSGFALTKIIVLGQAKCESVDRPTSGKDLARTVARLQRGWIGAYVTTSFFSDGNQIEMFEDEYPLITISGLQVAKATLQLVEKSGFQSVKQFLEEIESEYINSISNNSTEQVLNI
jgi:hypothetical protein